MIENYAIIKGTTRTYQELIDAGMNELLVNFVKEFVECPELEATMNIKIKEVN